MVVKKGERREREKSRSRTWRWMERNTFDPTRSCAGQRRSREEKVAKVIDPETEVRTQAGDSGKI